MRFPCRGMRPKKMGSMREIIHSTQIPLISFARKLQRNAMAKAEKAKWMNFATHQL